MSRQGVHALSLRVFFSVAYFDGIRKTSDGLQTQNKIVRQMSNKTNGGRYVNYCVVADGFAVDDVCDSALLSAVLGICFPV